MKLTGDQKVGIALALIAVFAAFAAFGCATKGDVRIAVADARKAEASDRTAAISAAVKGETTARNAQGDRLVGLIVDKGEALMESIIAERAERKTAVNGLTGRVAAVETTVAAQGKTLATKADVAEVDRALGLKAERTEVSTAIKGVQAEVTAVDRRVGAVNTRVSAVTNRVGVAETVGYLHKGITPHQLMFTTAKLKDADADTPEFEKCAEILVGTKKYLDEKVVAALKNGHSVAAISGFADSRPFVNKRGQVRKDSDALNAACAQARADAVYLYLVGAEAPGLDDTKVNGHGTTTRFGRHDADRSVVVEVTK